MIADGLIGVGIVSSESQVSFVFISGNSLSSTVLLISCTRVSFPPLLKFAIRRYLINSNIAGDIMSGQNSESVRVRQERFTF